MSIEFDPFAQLEREYTPELPLVTQETIDAVVSENVYDPQFVSQKFDQILIEQTPLAVKLGEYIQSTSKSEAEWHRTKGALALMYVLLEAQSRADELEEVTEVVITDNVQIFDTPDDSFDCN